MTTYHPNIDKDIKAFKENLDKQPSPDKYWENTYWGKDIPYSDRIKYELACKEIFRLGQIIESNYEQLLNQSKIIVNLNSDIQVLNETVTSKIEAAVEEERKKHVFRRVKLENEISNLKTANEELQRYKIDNFRTM